MKHMFIFVAIVAAATGSQANPTEVSGIDGKTLYTFDNDARPSMEPIASPFTYEVLGATPSLRLRDQAPRAKAIADKSKGDSHSVWYANRSDAGDTATYTYNQP